MCVCVCMRVRGREIREEGSFRGFGGYSMLHTSIFYEILETNMDFFADSKYVIFNNNT